MSKFAAALKEKAGAPINAAPKPVPKTAETGRSGSEEGAKHIGRVFHPPGFQTATLLDGGGRCDGAGFAG